MAILLDTFSPKKKQAAVENEKHHLRGFLQKLRFYCCDRIGCWRPCYAVQSQKGRKSHCILWIDNANTPRKRNQIPIAATPLKTSCLFCFGRESKSSKQLVTQVHAFVPFTLSDRPATLVLHYNVVVASHLCSSSALSCELAIGYTTPSFVVKGHCKRIEDTALAMHCNASLRRHVGISE